MHVTTLPCPRMLAFRPPRIALTLFAVSTALHLSIGDALPALPAFTIAAAAIASTGFLVMLRAWWLFRLHNTAICPTARTTSLLTSDIYGWTRNPMYLGIVMMLLGVAVYTGGILHYAAALAFFAIIDHSFCPYEEQKLRRDFPGKFDSYTRSVRRWL